MIPVDMTRTMLMNLDNDFVVLLRSSQDSRALPVSIGELEAQSIAIKLNSIEVPRPLTHDLLKNVLESFSATLLRVVISELRDETFFARLLIRHASETTELDARPSDAIALALRFNAPVFIEDSVMEQAGVILTGEEQAAALEGEEPQPSLETLSPTQELQRKLELAIAQEQYEEAAKLRDQIRTLSQTN